MHTASQKKKRFPETRVNKNRVNKNLVPNVKKASKSPRFAATVPHRRATVTAPGQALPDMISKRRPPQHTDIDILANLRPGGRGQGREWGSRGREKGRSGEVGGGRRRREGCHIVPLPPSPIRHTASCCGRRLISRRHEPSRQVVQGAKETGETKRLTRRTRRHRAAKRRGEGREGREGGEGRMLNEKSDCNW